MSNKSQPFKDISPHRVKASLFDYSYEKKFTCDMGQLIPVMMDLVLPGDRFKIGAQQVIRMNPMIAPMLHRIDVNVHYFFVPYRLLWDDWEDFITRGVTGDVTPEIPLWTPPEGGWTKYSLADYLGFPLGTLIPGSEPWILPKRAYNLVFNEFYRDQNLQQAVDLDQEAILYRNWQKDYFTSSLPFQQRGTAPSLPLSGFATVVGLENLEPNAHIVTNSYIAASTDGIVDAIAVTSDGTGVLAADLSGAGVSTFNVSALRLATATQRWQELSARAGARYTEFLKAHYRVAPQDSRLQRPEYIGGCSNPVIISEVLQTSSTVSEGDEKSAQGNMAGHGISVGSSYCGNYRFEEFGVMLGLLTIMPKPSYSGQGVPRQWTQRSSWDFYNPLFAHLSEQAITTGEIYAINDIDVNQSIFGYQGHWDEFRVANDMVVADMRDTFNYWHLARKFADRPFLNEDFIKCVPRKDVFADQVDPGFIVSHANILRSVRPLPQVSDPGYMDH